MQVVDQLRKGLAVERSEAGFRRTIAGWILVILNTLAALNSTFFFLLLVKSGVAGWLMMNSCAPSVYLFVMGFLIASPLVMVAASVPMAWYGTGGLFVFGWEGYNLIPQIGHILMTLAVIYVLLRVIRARAWRTMVLGLALGLAILIPFTIVQNRWFGAHPEMLEMLFSGDWALPGP